MHTEDLEQPTPFQCRHLFTDGRRCGSPALRGPEGHEHFCYYHHNTRKPAPAAARRRRRSRFALPLPEDRSAIQHSIGEVLRRLASGEVDPRRGGMLLYGLQIASLNLKKDPKKEEVRPVSEITLDPEHGPLALPAELGHDEPKGSIELLLESFDRIDAQVAAGTYPGRPAPTELPASRLILKPDA